MTKNLTSKAFSKLLIDWYQRHGRFDLPWQTNQTAYRVWVSEIMLQQTQVTTVIPYFKRFMSSFPNVKQLALANENDVLEHWSGLGYYARARNLHKTAKIIHEQFSGRFPKSVDALEKLPGIGRSTAGAVLSFAYELPTPICDGNVKRVLARIYAIDTPKQTTKATQTFWQLATELTPTKNTHRYNQAIMDLGATLCTRSKPKCGDCPFAKYCIAHAESNETAYPVSKRKKQIPVRKTALLLLKNNDDAFLLQRRPPTGIWGGLWCFPEFDVSDSLSAYCAHYFNLDVIESRKLNELVHKFSHFTLEISLLVITVKSKSGCLFDNTQQHWYKLDESLPGGIPAPVQKILTQLKIEQI